MRQHWHVWAIQKGEIGARLNISAETVKVRLQRALAKFGVTTRSQLRMLLEEWDFSAWEKPKYR